MKRLIFLALIALGAVEASAQGYTRAWLPDPTCDGVVVRTAANTTTCRTITAGTGAGVVNGDGVSGNPTVTLDINGLTAEPLINPFDDTIPFYDSSAAANRKVLFGGNTKVGRSYWVIESEFIASGGNGLSMGLFGYNTGAASSAGALAAEAGRNGMIECSTGTDTNGAAAVLSNNAVQNGILDIQPASGRIEFTGWVRFPTLSDGTNTYKAWIGLANSTIPSAAPVDGVDLTYTSAENSGKWRGACSEDSATTYVEDTGTAVAAGTWYRVSFMINAAATSVEFFINGTSIGSCGTNVPDSNDNLAPNLQIIKSAGTTARSMTVDAVRYVGEFTTAR